MLRILLTAYGAIVCRATFWAVLGSAAAIYASHLPGGTREGANAMGGFFLIGGARGFLGMLLGGG